MALTFGQLSFIGAIGLFGSREIERKLAQRRIDPKTFRETPVALAGGTIIALTAAGLAARLGGAASPFAGIDDDEEDERKIRGTFCERKERPKGTFDRRSFRWKKSGDSWVLVGCPKGKFNAKREKCRVGTRAYKVLSRKSSKGRCRTGRRVKK